MKEKDIVIRKATKLKVELDEQQQKYYNKFDQDFKDMVNTVLKKIDSIYKEYKDTTEKETKCHACDKPGTYTKINKDKKYICHYCLKKTYNYFSLYRIRDQLPQFSNHTGYIVSALKAATRIYTSYLTKVEDRNEEIKKLKIKIEAETIPRRKEKLLNKLKHKTKGVQFPVYRGGVIEISGGMYEFKADEQDFYIGIADQNTLRTKNYSPLKLGKPDEYHTQHNKFRIVEKSIKEKDNSVETKLRRYTKKKKDNYEFIYSTKSISRSLTHNTQIEELLNKNKKTPVTVLVFDVKKPIRCVTYIKGKIVNKKTFGSGYLFHYISHQRKYRAKMKAKFANKYKTKARRNKARKNFFRKRDKVERKFINTYLHKLTTKVIEYIHDNYPKSVVVMQNTDHIKTFDYGYPLKGILARWNIAEQKSKLLYKLMEKHINVYDVRYIKSNIITCNKCKQKFKKDKNEIRYLTVLLQITHSEKEELIHKIHMLEKKIKKILTYKKSDKMRLALKKTKEELTETQHRLKNLDEKSKLFTCEKCSHQNNLYDLLANHLYSCLHEGCEMTRLRAN